MNINNIIFYNYEKNGDCFLNKGYVADIMKKLPDVGFSYAHDRDSSIIQDLGCRFIRTSQIPRDVTTHQKCVYHEDTGTVFINTWIGAWIGVFLSHGQHANFPLMHTAWQEFYKILELPVGDDFSDYFPEIDYTQYDLSAADDYLKKIHGRELVLFCNGVPQSGQSSMGNMRAIIQRIATDNPSLEFAVAYKLDLQLPNITYTDDMFKSNVGNLNQISYISQQAKLIVGKNSGPFTFCHTKNMLNNSKSIFLSFNHRLTDCLMGGGTYVANSYFSNTLDDAAAIGIITQLLSKTDYNSIKAPTHQIG